MAEPLVPLGEIVATHGLDGWLRLNPLNPTSKTLSPGLSVHLQKSGKHWQDEIEASKRHKNQLLIKFRDVNHIDRAERYVGSILLVDETSLEVLTPGQFYQYQIVGFAVFDLKGRAIGTISGILSTPGGELYVVQGTDKEYLVPAAKELIEQVDFGARKVVINPPEGLLDL